MKARRWLLLAFLVALALVVITRFVEIERVIRTLLRGQWQWVAVGAGLQFLHYLTYAAMFSAGFEAVGVAISTLQLLPVVFASVFVNVLAITGGAAIFVDDAARRGQSAARATAGTLLVLVADFGTFIVVLIGGLLYLSYRRVLLAYQLLGTAILAASVLGQGAILALGWWQPRWLEALFGWLQRAINWLFRLIGRPAPLADDWATRSVAEFIGAAAALATHPRVAWRLVGISFAHHAAGVASLYAVFLAFGQPGSIGVVTAAYTVGLLFWIISITPQGVGVVEGVMVLVLVSLGVPAAEATVITFAFRALAFWLPLLVGVAFWPRVKSLGG
jgi:uncharacterized protein (TIRG00374 family)